MIRYTYLLFIVLLTSCSTLKYKPNSLDIEKNKMKNSFLIQSQKIDKRVPNLELEVSSEQDKSEISNTKLFWKIDNIW